MNYFMHSVLQKPTLRHAFYAIAYYLLGFLLTCIIYKLSGTPYPHGPNLFHIVGFLVLLGGVVWLITCFATLYKKQGHIGALIVHLLVFGGIALSIAYEINREPDLDTDIGPKQEDTFTIYKDTLSNQFSIVDGKGDTLYLKSNDSTVIDKLRMDTIKGNAY
jgi:hypothetical protein